MSTTTPYELVRTPTGVTARLHARGPAVLGASGINRGTAFTLPEREALGLTGLLPTGVSTLEAQAGSTPNTRRRAATFESGCC